MVSSLAQPSPPSSATSIKSSFLVPSAQSHSLEPSSPTPPISRKSNIRTSSTPLTYGTKPPATRPAVPLSNRLSIASTSSFASSSELPLYLGEDKVTKVCKPPAYDELHLVQGEQEVRQSSTRVKRRVADRGYPGLAGELEHLPRGEAVVEESEGEEEDTLLCGLDLLIARSSRLLCISEEILASTSDSRRHLSRFLDLEEELCRVEGDVRTQLEERDRLETTSEGIGTEVDNFLAELQARAKGRILRKEPEEPLEQIDPRSFLRRTQRRASAPRTTTVYINAETTPDIFFSEISPPLPTVNHLRASTQILAPKLSALEVPALPRRQASTPSFVSPASHALRQTISSLSLTLAPPLSTNPSTFSNSLTETVKESTVNHPTVKGALPTFSRSASPLSFEETGTTPIRMTRSSSAPLALLTPSASMIRTFSRGLLHSRLLASSPFSAPAIDTTVHLTPSNPSLSTDLSTSNRRSSSSTLLSPREEMNNAEIVSVNVSGEMRNQTRRSRESYGLRERLEGLKDLGKESPNGGNGMDSGGSGRKTEARGWWGWS